MSYAPLTPDSTAPWYQEWLAGLTDRHVSIHEYPGHSGWQVDRWQPPNPVCPGGCWRIEAVNIPDLETAKRMCEEAGLIIAVVTPFVGVYSDRSSAFAPNRQDDRQ